MIVDRHGVWIDPDRRAVQRIAATTGQVAQQLQQDPPQPADPAWSASWASAARHAEHVLATELAEQVELTEPWIAHHVTANTPPGSAIVLASSMPVRDVEWYAPARHDVVFLSNRGANGIDGVVSTAIGVALSGRRTTVLIGDIAFLHDSSALIALRARPVDLTIVVMDNDGGGIFSFLPQAEVLDPARFELLFGTPHGTDIAALCRAHGLAVVEPATHAEFAAAFATAGRAAGIQAIVVRSDRAANVAAHRRLHEAVHRTRFW